jgi:hypothetical protein
MIYATFIQEDRKGGCIMIRKQEDEELNEFINDNRLMHIECLYFLLSRNFRDDCNCWKKIRASHPTQYCDFLEQKV